MRYGIVRCYEIESFTDFATENFIHREIVRVTIPEFKSNRYYCKFFLREFVIPRMLKSSIRPETFDIGLPGCKEGDFVSYRVPRLAESPTNRFEVCTFEENPVEKKYAIIKIINDLPKSFSKDKKEIFYKVKKEHEK